MGTWFLDNLLRLLPEEYAYLDRDLGDLKDFLEVIAISFDEFDGFIEDFASIFDVDTCEAKYLPYLAKMLNYPLSERDTVESQRLQLRYAVEGYKRKGLEESFRILFYSLGYIVSLSELWTKNYEQFYKYPGTFQPAIFQAVVVGTSSTTITISEATRNLLVRIDGGSSISVVLTLGTFTLSQIADQIDSYIDDEIGGQCLVDGGNLKIRSLQSGKESSVRLEPTHNSAYSLLGFKEGTWFGFDPRVPDDWPELLENGGGWYKSPHFGLEVFSLKDYVLDPAEFDYIRDRIELIRPVHTVLDWIDYVKSVSDAYSVSEETFIATIEPKFVEVWPFPVCIDRGRNTTFEYIRDGLVPDRSEATRLSYKHIRNAFDNCARRGQFTYPSTPLSRNIVGGPPQMLTRGEIRFFRDGYHGGADAPYRDSCGQDTEDVSIDMAFEMPEDWCISFPRSGGAKHRNVPDTYYRDGSFSLITTRDPCQFNRDGSDVLLSRSGCPSPPTDEDLVLLFERPDLPGVWFPSLAAMNDPNTVGETTPLPGPGEQGPSL